MRNKGDFVFCGMFLFPALLIYSVFMILPVIASGVLSFFEWDVFSLPVFVGLGNYAYLFQDADYWIVLRNTLALVFGSALVQVPCGLVIAFALSRTAVLFKTMRSLFFLPVVIAPTAIGIMFTLLYNGDFGPLNVILNSVGLESLSRAWLSDPSTVLPAVIFPQVWQYIGLFVAILLAAIMSIENEIFESAEIDGASSVRVFFSIVLPIIADVLSVCVILAVTGSLKSFDHAWVMTTGGPGTASSYLGIYMYKIAFLQDYYGMGSTIAVTILAYALGFTVVFGRLVKNADTA